jgi:hypothetical protein
MKDKIYRDNGRLSFWQTRHIFGFGISYERGECVEYWNEITVQFMFWYIELRWGR